MKIDTEMQRQIISCYLTSRCNCDCQTARQTEATKYNDIRLTDYNIMWREM